LTLVSSDKVVTTQAKGEVSGRFIRYAWKYMRVQGLMGDLQESIDSPHKDDPGDFGVGMGCRNNS
jgi:hypothetical protein